MLSDHYFETEENVKVLKISDKKLKVEWKFTGLYDTDLSPSQTSLLDYNHV